VFILVILHYKYESEALKIIWDGYALGLWDNKRYDTKIKYHFQMIFIRLLYIRTKNMSAVLPKTNRKQITKRAKFEFVCSHIISYKN